MTQRNTAWQPESMRRTWPIALLLAGYGAVAFVYLQELARTVPPDSDSATVVLMAQDMLKGNWILHGWRVPPTFFWLTDLPLYAAAISLQGFGVAVLHSVPAWVYLCLLILVCVATAAPFSRTRTAAFCGAFVGLLPIVFPSRLLSMISLVGPFHISTIAILLAFLLALEILHVRRNAIRLISKVLLTIAASLLCSAAIVGDPFAIWIGILPVTIVSGLDGAARYHVKHANVGSVLQALLPVLLSVGAWLLAAVALRFVISRGGFAIVPLPSIAAMFVELRQLGQNIFVLIQDTLELSGGDFFGSRLSLWTLPTFVRLAGLMAAGLSVWIVFREWWRGREIDWLSRVLSVSCVLLMLAFAVSQFSAVEGTRSARYIVPVIVFGSIVAGRWAGRMALLVPIKKGWLLLAMGTMAVTYALAPLIQVAAGPSMFPASSLTEFLEQHNLHTGLGAYWDASVVTVASGGAATVRPVVAEQSRIVPYRRNSARAWYSPQTAFTFLVFDKSNWGNVGWKTAERTFGQPTSVYYLETFTILVWSDGISVDDDGDRP